MTSNSSLQTHVSYTHMNTHTCTTHTHIEGRKIGWLTGTSQGLAAAGQDSRRNRVLFQDNANTEQWEAGKSGQISSGTWRASWKVDQDRRVVGGKPMMPQPLVKGSSSDVQHEEKVSNALSGVWGKMHGCSCFEGSLIPGVDSPQYMTLCTFSVSIMVFTQFSNPKHKQ